MRRELTGRLGPVPAGALVKLEGARFVVLHPLPSAWCRHHIAAADTAEGVAHRRNRRVLDLVGQRRRGAHDGDSYTVRWTTLHPDAQGKVVSLWFSGTTADEDEMTVDDSLDLASESIKVSSGIPNVGSYDGQVPQLDFDQPTLWRVQARASRARADRVGCHGFAHTLGAMAPQLFVNSLPACTRDLPLYDPSAAQDLALQPLRYLPASPPPPAASAAGQLLAAHPVAASASALGALLAIGAACSYVALSRRLAKLSELDEAAEALDPEYF